MASINNRHIFANVCVCCAIRGQVVCLAHSRARACASKRVLFAAHILVGWPFGVYADFFLCLSHFTCALRRRRQKRYIVMRYAHMPGKRTAAGGLRISVHIKHKNLRSACGPGPPPEMRASASPFCALLLSVGSRLTSGRARSSHLRPERRCRRIGDAICCV